MKKIIKKIKILWTSIKIRLQRANTYLAIINAGGILFLILSKLQDYGINIEIKRWFIPIYLFTLLILFVIGWIDDKIGLYSEELDQNNQRNPFVKEVLTKLEEIEKKINDSKNENK